MVVQFAVRRSRQKEKLVNTRKLTQKISHMVVLLVAKCSNLLVISELICKHTVNHSPIDVLFAAKCLATSVVWIDIYRPMVGCSHIDVPYVAESSVKKVPWIHI